jgi:hypothetical protein
MDQGGRRSKVGDGELGDGKAGVFVGRGECALKRRLGAEGMASPPGTPHGRRALRCLGNRRAFIAIGELPGGVIKKVDPASVATKRDRPIGCDIPRAVGAPDRTLPR